MITVDNDSEFSLTIKSVAEELSRLDKFVIKIWVTGSELSFKFNESWDIHFISESIRFSLGDKIKYVAMDSIMAIDIYVNANWDDIYD